MFISGTNGWGVGTPGEAVSKEDAFLLVCIAGEVYAEIQGYYTGTGPNERGRILTEVDEFSRKKQDIDSMGIIFLLLFLVQRLCGAYLPYLFFPK
jgi:hypothetical protein